MNNLVRSVLVLLFLNSGNFISTAVPGFVNHPDNAGEILHQSSLFLPVECSYAEFFSQVMKYHTGLVKSVQTGDCFRVRTYEEPEYFETEKARYRLSITFYCQYGYSGTRNGVDCYGELLTVFMSWLKGKGYAVKKLEDLSMTGWDKVLYRATSGQGSVLFVYESENAGSMGYAKIRLLKQVKP
ncbi:MAG TPA: hypothetical protein PKJ24_05555 [Prolixibacteraceae bacterium]|nr:hypothetical protein [Prolixibacteraceae bacterium]